MLDIKLIKENPDAVKAGLKAKEVDCDASIDRILELDARAAVSSPIPRIRRPSKTRSPSRSPR